MAATAPGAGGSAPAAAGSAEAPLQYSLLLQYLVGDRRQPRVLEPGSLGGIPSPAKSEEQKMIERAMESCAFKAALACLGGEVRRGAAGGGALGRLRARLATGFSAGKTGRPAGLHLNCTSASLSELGHHRWTLRLAFASGNDRRISTMGRGLEVISG